MTIDATQATGNYWMNITFGGSGRCGTSVNPYPAAIIHYEGASGGLPADQGSTPADHQCLDLINLTPVVTRTVPTAGFSPSNDNTLDVVSTNRNWTVSNSSQVVDWSKPVAQYVINNDTTWPGMASENVWQVDEPDQVSNQGQRANTRDRCQVG